MRQQEARMIPNSGNGLSEKFMRKEKRGSGNPLLKKALMVLVAVAALAGTLTFVAAGSFKREPVTEAEALPAYEILTTVRAMGINPISEPVRRGPYYVLQATDARGIQVRVIADAQFGDILSIAPARVLNNAYAPRFEGGARIIHVPQPGDRNDRASVNDRDEPAVSNDDDADVAPPPRRRVAPPPQQHSDAPPPPPSSPRRTVLSAPPPPAEGPTPVRPTPRFNSKAEQAEKFGPPADVTVTPSAPPAALPQATEPE